MYVRENFTLYNIHYFLMLCIIFFLFINILLQQILLIYDAKLSDSIHVIKI